MTVTPDDGGHDRPDENFDRVVYYTRPPWWERLLSAAVQLIIAPGWVGALKLAFLAAVFVMLYIALHHLA